MITGFNTDVKHAEIVYHVQTEDKGANNPLIESLVYVKGAILDAFRTRYQDFLKSERFSEAVLQKVLEFQHHQIVVSIKRGKYEKGMRLNPYIDGDLVFKSESACEPSKDSKPVQIPPPPSEKPVEAIPSPLARNEPPLAEVQSQISLPGSARKTESMSVPIKPAAELEVRSVDIAALSGEQGIEICVDGSKEFHGGEQVDLQLYVQSRNTRVRIENVQVVIKIIGTTFSPRLYAGKTDKSGSLRINFSLPTFAGGSAALIIQASTSIGNDEVKYLIKRRR
jgi:hypothetical protein